MRYDNRWDDLGRTIRDAVDQAVGSQDFEKLNQTIRQAVESGNEAIRRAAQVKAQAVPQTKSIQKLYGSTGGCVVRGVVKTVLGVGIGAFCGLGLLGAGVLGMLTSQFASAIGIMLGGVGGGALLGFSGIRNLSMVSRFRTYRRLLGTRTTCALEKLAKAVGKSVKFVREDLERMFGKGLFLEGHLDREQTMLITSDATYREFEAARLALEEARRQQAKADAQKPDPRVLEVQEKGSAFIAQIRKCNDDIPGEEVSAKIDRMELLVRRIFDRAREHPEVVPDLKKLMDYYLPMTVKLLNAYADMDAQPIQGGTIEASKREIEGTLDTLNLAFEKLLDELFQDTALDVSSDITVLQTMLAQEGLTEDDLTRMRRQSQ